MKKLTLLIVSAFLTTNVAFSQGKYIEIGLGKGPGAFSPVLGLQKDFTLGKKDRLLIAGKIANVFLTGQDSVEANFLLKFFLAYVPPAHYQKKHPQDFHYCNRHIHNHFS